MKQFIIQKASETFEDIYPILLLRGNDSQASSASGSALTQEIWDERRLEFAGEGHRFFDLVRTGQAAGKITGFVEGKHEVFPIPQTEVDVSNLTQNPGY